MAFLAVARPFGRDVFDGRARGTTGNATRSCVAVVKGLFHVANLAAALLSRWTEMRMRELTSGRDKKAKRGRKGRRVLQRDKYPIRHKSRELVMHMQCQ
jgi:hypothetical protein